MKLSSGSVNVLQCEDVFEGLTPEVCLDRSSVREAGS